jgi:hypothetical protein
MDGSVRNGHPAAAGATTKSLQKLGGPVTDRDSTFIKT